MKKIIGITVGTPIKRFIPAITEEDEGKALVVQDGGLVFQPVEGGGGSGSSDNAVFKVTIPTTPSTTVIDMVTAMQNAGGKFGEWNVINLTGYTTETLGLQIESYGGTIYGIQGVNLSNMYVITNACDWTGITISELMKKFNPALPTYNSDNEGHFLRIVDGNVTWSAVPNGDEVSY